MIPLFDVRKKNAPTVIGVIVIGVIVCEITDENLLSLRENFVALKGNKNLMHSYEKLSPQLCSKIFLTGGQN